MITHFQDKRGKWRWHLKADNGRIIAASSQGYANFSDSTDNLLDIFEYLANHHLQGVKR